MAVHPENVGLVGSEACGGFAREGDGALVDGANDVAGTKACAGGRGARCDARDHNTTDPLFDLEPFTHGLGERFEAEPEFG